MKCDQCEQEAAWAFAYGGTNSLRGQVCTTHRPAVENHGIALAATITWSDIRPVFSEPGPEQIINGLRAELELSNSERETMALELDTLRRDHSATLLALDERHNELELEREEHRKALGALNVLSTTGSRFKLRQRVAELERENAALRDQLPPTVVEGRT